MHLFTIAAPQSLNYVLTNFPFQPTSLVPSDDETILFVPSESSLALSISTFGDIQSSVCASQCQLVRDAGATDVGICGSVASFVIRSR